MKLSELIAAHEADPASNELITLPEGVKPGCYKSMALVSPTRGAEPQQLAAQILKNAEMQPGCEGFRPIDDFFSTWKRGYTSTDTDQYDLNGGNMRKPKKGFGLYHLGKDLDKQHGSWLLGDPRDLSSTFKSKPHEIPPALLEDMKNDPSLAPRRVGLVINDHIEEKSWHKNIPPSEQSFLGDFEIDNDLLLADGPIDPLRFRASEYPYTTDNAVKSGEFMWCVLGHTKSEVLKALAATIQEN